MAVVVDARSSVGFGEPQGHRISHFVSLVALSTVAFSPFCLNQVSSCLDPLPLLINHFVSSQPLPFSEVALVAA